MREQTSEQTVRSFGWIYDVESRLQLVGDNGHLIGLVYDDLDRVREVNALTVGASVLVSMASAYDAAGLRTNLTAKRGATKDFENVYTFDNAGRMTSVTQQSQTGGVAVAPKHVAFEDNDLGPFTSIRRFEATTDDWDYWAASSDFMYDQAGRLKQIYPVAPGSSGVAFQGIYGLAYDRARRITEIATSTVGAPSFYFDTAEFAYDDRDHVGRGGTRPRRKREAKESHAMTPRRKEGKRGQLRRMSHSPRCGFRPCRHHPTRARPKALPYWAETRRRKGRQAGSARVGS